MPDITTSPSVSAPLRAGDFLYGQRDGEAVKKFSFEDVKSSVSGGWTPSNYDIALFGDSISDQQSDANITYARGYLAQAQAILGQRFSFTNSLNFGVFGNDTGQMLARVSAVIAARPARVLFKGGINDPTNGLTPAQTVANIRAIIDALNGAGIAVDIIPILPRSYNTTAAMRAHYAFANAHIRAERNRRPRQLFGVVNIDGVVGDKGSSTWAPRAGTMAAEPSADFGQLHLLGYGGQILGMAVAEYYRDIFPGYDDWDWSPANTLDVANGNIYGSVFTNPAMLGSIANTGTGVTGTVPTGIKVERSSGSTIAGASVVNVDAADGNARRLTVTLSGGTGGAAQEFLRVLPATSGLSTAGIPAGSMAVTEWYVRQTNLVNVCNIKVFGYINNAVVQTALGGSGITGDREVPTLTRVIRTQPYEITSPGTHPAQSHLYVAGDCTGAGVSGVVDVLGMRIRVIPS